MKKYFIILALFVCVTSHAQYHKDYVAKNGSKNMTTEGSLPQDFRFKVNVVAGKTLPTSEYLKNISKGPLAGVELAFEMPAWGAYNWHQYYHNPTLGVAFGVIDLGNPKLMGVMITAYPYLLVPLAKKEHFELNVKLGAGVALVTKNWHSTDTTHRFEPPYNFNNAVGSVANMYLTAGFDFNFPINPQWAINLDLGYSHVGNGSIMQPNFGYDNVHAQLGLSYTLYKDVLPGMRAYPAKFDRYPYDISLDFTLAGGYRENYMYDNKGFGVGYGSVGTTFSLANWYALGAQVDFFYDDTFRKTYNAYRYNIEKESATQAFRLGFALANEFRVGRVALLFDWGVYLFDPVKNMHKTMDYGQHKGLFYRYNPKNEDGWNYFQLGLRCRIWDNLYGQIMCKSHLNRAEMLTFGVGYSLKWRKNRAVGRNPKFEPLYDLYHPGDENKVTQFQEKNEYKPNYEQPKPSKFKKRRFRPI